MNRAAFFAALRGTVFPGGLKQSQVTTIDAILDAAGERGTPLTHLSYMLATARWEPGEDMQPREENLYYTTARRIQAVWPSRFPTVAAAQPFVRNPRALANKVYNGRMGNRPGSDDGWIFRGRGLPMITGRTNYRHAAQKTGIPLEAEPRRALELPIAVAILVDGMEGGWFTGVTSAGAAATKTFEDDRRIINGTDKAAVIAAIAVQFETALREAGWAGRPASAPAPIPTPPAGETAVLEALRTHLAVCPVDAPTLDAVLGWLSDMRSIEA